MRLYLTKDDQKRYSEYLQTLNRGETLTSDEMYDFELLERLDKEEVYALFDTPKVANSGG
jgi:hypothetical protein